MGGGASNVRGGGDVLDAFAAFARAAAARRTTVVPLVEMSKIAVGVGAMLDSGAISGAVEPVPSRDSELLRGPLILSRPYTRAVESALAEEIARRLEAFPVSAESAYALDRLSECVSGNIEVCVPLAEKLEAWYVIALGNPRMNPEDRALLKMSHGRFLAARGETERALASMGEAARIEPRNLGYPLSLAALHMQLDQWDEVAGILDELESRPSWSGFGSRQIRWLRTQYENNLRASSQ